MSEPREELPDGSEDTPVDVSLELASSTFSKLEGIAAYKEVSPNRVVNEAIAIYHYLIAARQRGTRIILLQTDGKRREVVLPGEVDDLDTDYHDEISRFLADHPSEETGKQ